MKYKTLSLLLFAPALSMAQPANLSYDYLNVEAGPGRLMIEDPARLDYKTHSVYGSASMMLTPNVFTSVSLGKTRGDDKDALKGVAMELDTKQTDVRALVGYALPFAKSSDFVLKVGTGRMEQKNTSRLLTNPTAGALTEKDTETGAVWEVGTRTLFADPGFELELAVQRFRDQTSYTIGGPTYLTENLGLNLSYTYSKDTAGPKDTRHKALTVGVRYYF